MDSHDLSHLLDSNGNLKNDIMAFAFTATMLSTIPLLVGSELGVLKRRRRQAGPYSDPDEDEIAYMASPFAGQATLTSYKNLMTSSTASTSSLHVHGSPGNQEQEDEDASAAQLVESLLHWSQKELENRSLVANMLSLMLDRYNGNVNPADKLVSSMYKKWRKYWYQ